MTISKEAIRQVLLVAKRMDQKGILNAIEGNISVRCGDLIYVTPSGKNKAFLTEDMIAVVDINGNQVAGSCKPTSELKLHLHVYQIRSDINGIVHAHPHYLTAHALCRKPVRSAAYPEVMVVYGSIEVAAYGRPGTDDIYKEVGPLLENSDVVLLANHGAMAVGSNVIDAMNSLEAAESSTRILALAEGLGEPQELSDEECAVLYDLHKQRIRNSRLAKKQ